MDKKIQYCNLDFPNLPIDSVHLDKNNLNRICVEMGKLILNIIWK